MYIESIKSAWFNRIGLNIIVIICFLHVLFILPIAAQEAEVLQPAELGSHDESTTQDCSTVDIAEDTMGLRIRDMDGNWRYLVSSELKLTMVARLSETQGIWAHVVPKAVLKKYFGQCADVYGPMVAAVVPGLVDFKASGMKVNNLGLGTPLSRESSPDYEVDALFAGRINPISAELFVLEGTDLLVWDGTLYAVNDDRDAFPLPGVEAQEREKMSGIVRQMADALCDKGKVKIKVLKVWLEANKLRAQIELRPKGLPKETLAFEEK